MAERSLSSGTSVHKDRLVLGLIALVALVNATTLVKVIASGWRLIGDDAVIALRSTDVFRSGSPLLGMPSAFSSWSTGADPFHPGPALFWWLAPWTSLFGATPTVVLFATWLLAVTSIVTIATVSYRQLGRSGAIAGLATAVVFQLIAAGPSWKPINPVAAGLPCVAFCFLTWAVLAGDRRVLPAWVGFGTFVAQTDFAYAPTLVVPVAVVLGSWAWRLRREAGPRRALVRTSVGALVVGLVMWAPAIAEAVVNRGGNALEVRVAAAQDVEVVGWRAVVSTIGLLLDPTWFVNPESAVSRIGRFPGLGPGTAIGVVLLIVGLRGAATVTAARRAAAMTALAVGAGSVAAQAATPAHIGVNRYCLLGTWAAAAFTWFALAIVTPAGWRVILRRKPTAVGVAPLPVVMATMVLLVPVTALAIQPSASSDRWHAEVYPAVDPVADLLVRELEPGPYEIRALGGPGATAMLEAVVVRVDRRGIECRTEPPLAKYLGAERLRDGSERGVLLVAIDAAGPPVAGAQLIVERHTLGSNRAGIGRVRRDVAAAVRSDPEARASGSPFWIGGILAASGDIDPMPTVLDDSRLSQIGERLTAGRIPLSGLSDLALSELVGAGQIVGGRPHASPAQAADLDRVFNVSVWLSPPS